MAGETPEPKESTEITIDGQTGHIGYDRISNPNATLERSWIFVHDGTRALGVVATYVASAASHIRPGMQAMLREAQWNRARG